MISLIEKAFFGFMRVEKVTAIAFLYRGASDVPPQTWNLINISRNTGNCQCSQHQSSWSYFELGYCLPKKQLQNHLLPLQ